MEALFSTNLAVSVANVVYQVFEDGGKYVFLSENSDNAFHNFSFVRNGDSWSELTAMPGLPRGTWGIAGVAVSPVAPRKVSAMRAPKSVADDSWSTWSWVRTPFFSPLAALSIRWNSADISLFSSIVCGVHNYKTGFFNSIKIGEPVKIS